MKTFSLLLILILGHVKSLKENVGHAPHLSVYYVSIYSNKEYTNNINKYIKETLIIDRKY